MNEYKRVGSINEPNFQDEKEPLFPTHNSYKNKQDLKNNDSPFYNYESFSCFFCETTY